MQGLLAIAAVLLLAVAVFAFQNPDPVTVRFLHWELSASVAVVTLAAALLSLATRLVRWTRHHAVATSGAAPTNKPGSAPPPAWP